MKRKLLLCTVLLLTVIAGLLVSPTVIPALSKNKTAVEIKRQPHNAFVLAAVPDSDNDNSIIQRGFELAPVPLDLRGKNRALVGLGSYIVNTGGCNDCHTNPPYAPGGDPFQGQPEQINVPCYLSGGGFFGPGVIARNLTPNSQGRPAGLTLEEFIHTLRTGEDLDTPGVPPDDHGLLQVMPWPVFGKKTDRDLTAIYEYLRSIPRRPPCS
jgi:hypothetical protein